MSCSVASFYRVTPRNGRMHSGSIARLLSFLADMTIVQDALRVTLTDLKDISVAAYAICRATLSVLIFEACLKNFSGKLWSWSTANKYKEN